MIDWDAFEERAAIAEYDGGLSRFEAETLAARAQGLERWQVMGAVHANSMGNSEQARDQRAAAHGDAAHDLPGVQSGAEEENGSVLERHVHSAGRAVAMPSLRVQGNKGVGR